MEVKVISGIKEFLRKPDQSINRYLHPFPSQTKIEKIIKDYPSHKGPFKGAIDFIVPLGTPVLAPLEGIVTAVVDTNDKFGPTEDFKDFLNYITIRHSNGEYSQPAHLAKGSVLVKIGDNVKEGQQLAVTGNSGWMTEPHLHFFVFKAAPTKEGFIGLNPRFK